MIFARASAVFVKIGTKHAKVSVIEDGGGIANRAVECLDHVHAREVRGKVHACKQICHGVARQLLGLNFFGPRTRAYRTVTSAFGLRAALSLNDLNIGVVDLGEGRVNYLSVNENVLVFIAAEPT